MCRSTTLPFIITFHLPTIYRRGEAFKGKRADNAVVDWTPDKLFKEINRDRQRIGIATDQVLRALDEGFYIEAILLEVQQIRATLTVLIYFQLHMLHVDLNAEPQLEKILLDKSPGSEKRALDRALIYKAIDGIVHERIRKFFSDRNKVVHDYLSIDYTNEHLQDVALEGRKILTDILVPQVSRGGDDLDEELKASGFEK